MSAPVRVAAVGYTNAWPLITRLDRIRFRVMERHPAEVARLLREDQADVGLIPVAALLNDADYRVVPGYCIGSEGPVHSVLLVAETPPEEWTAVALDGVSRTSQILSRLLLQHGPLADRTGELTFFETEPGRALESARGTVAGLVIGDAARVLPDRLSCRIDLGQAWTDWTELPFVFAVWAGRPDLDPGAMEAMRRAAAEGLEMRESLPEPDRSYVMESIRYPLDDRALMGLRRFAALGADAGLLRRQEVQLYGPSVHYGDRVDLDTLLLKAAAGGALTEDQALELYELAPTTELVAAAHLKRSDAHPPHATTYALVERVESTASVDAVRAAAAAVVDAGGAALLLEGAPDSLGSLVERIRVAREAGAQVRALTVRELLALRGERSLDALLQELVDAGLEGLLADDGVLLDDAIRKTLSPDAVSVEDWRAVVEAAGRAGLRLMAGLRFGRVDTPAHRIRHLMQLADLHRRSGALTGVVCRPWTDPRLAGDDTAADTVRLVAMSRLMLDDALHISVDVDRLGANLSQNCLHAGADDAGAIRVGSDLKVLERHLREAGFEPTRRDARFRVLGGAVTRPGWRARVRTGAAQ